MDGPGPASVFRAAFVAQLRNQFYSVPAGLTYVFTPATFATTVALLYRGTDSADLYPYVVSGSAIFAVWHSSFYVSSVFVQIERSLGTMELHLAMPVSLFTVMAGKSLANSTQGLVGAFVGVFVTSYILGGLPPISPTPLLAVAISLTIISLSAFGLFFGPIFFIARRPTGALGVISTAVILFSGTLYPREVLPLPLEAVSWVLPPRWASGSIRGAMGGDHSEDILPSLVMLVFLTVAYLWSARTMYGRLEERLRRTGSLDRL